MESVATVPLLIIDDFGMRKLPDTAAEDLLEIIMRRYERFSTLLTSNRPVEDWGKLLGEVAAVSRRSIGCCITGMCLNAVHGAGEPRPRRPHKEWSTRRSAIHAGSGFGVPASSLSKKPSMASRATASKTPASKGGSLSFTFSSMSSGT